MRTYDQLKQVMLSKGYRFTEGELELNLIFERTNDEFTNRFTDWWYIPYMHGGQKQIIAIPATTKPGLRGSVMEPTTVEGVTGTAVIEPGQYVNAWKFVDDSNGFSKYPYFLQVGKLNYWRDGNKNSHLDKVQEQKGKVFGTCLHRMSQTGTWGSGEVNNWSLGCMGSPEPEFKKILEVVRAAVKVHGLLFTGTVLETKDFPVNITA